MGGKKKLYILINDEQAVSEEFTSLPAITVVLVGFTFFFVLVAQVVLVYETRMAALDLYHTTDILAAKLITPESFFIREGGLVDYQVLHTDTQSLEKIQQQYQTGGVHFFLRLRWNNYSEDFPEASDNSAAKRIALTKTIGIYLNEAQTVPGTFTIVLWREIE